jgi:hypothetical protein
VDLSPAKRTASAFEKDSEMRTISVYRWIILIAITALLLVVHYA